MLRVIRSPNAIGKARWPFTHRNVRLGIGLLLGSQNRQPEGPDQTQPGLTQRHSTVQVTSIWCCVVKLAGLGLRAQCGARIPRAAAR